MRTTIDRAGRLVIPKHIRDLAGYKPGVKLDIDYVNGAVVIEPVCTAVLVRKGSFLVSRVPGAPKMTLRQSNRFIRRMRNGQL